MGVAHYSATVLMTWVTCHHHQIWLQLSTTTTTNNGDFGTDNSEQLYGDSNKNLIWGYGGMIIFVESKDDTLKAGLAMTASMDFGITITSMEGKGMTHSKVIWGSTLKGGHGDDYIYGGKGMITQGLHR